MQTSTRTMRWSMRWIARIAPLLLVFTSIANASAETRVVDGSLTLLGPATLPTGTSLTMDRPLAVYDDDTSHTEFTLTTPLVRVHSYSDRAIGVPSLLVKEVSFDERTWSLRNVTIHLMPGGDNSGSLGIYPSDVTKLAFTASSPMDIEPRQNSPIPANRQVEKEDNYPLYSQLVSGEHAYFATAGSLSSTGRQVVKITGLDMRVVAAENTTDWQTGTTTTPTETDTQWVKLELDSGTIMLSSPEAPIECAARDAAVAWDGEAWLTPTQGELRTDDGVYAASGERASLDGTFTMTLAPAAPVASTMSLTNLNGDLRSTSLRYVPAPAGPTILPLRLWLVGLVAIVVSSGGAAAVVMMRRRVARTSAAYSSYGERAEEAADGREWQLAVDLLEKAREVEPHRGGLVDRQGMYLLMAGEMELALCAFDAASYLMVDGTPERMAAYCAVQLGDEEKAEYYLQRALERTPHLSLLDEIEEDTVFAAVLQRDALQDALARARERLERE